MDDEPTVAEEFAMALAVRLYRQGLLTADDCGEIAEQLEAKAAAATGAEAERLEAAANLAAAVPVEAEAPPQSEWKAAQARARFRVVKDP